MKGNSYPARSFPLTISLYRLFHGKTTYSVWHFIMRAHLVLLLVYIESTHGIWRCFGCDTTQSVRL